MESLGNGRRVVDGGLGRSSARERLRHPFDRWFRASLMGLLGLLLLAGGIAHAQSTRYVYDANGRVVAVTASSGTSVQYGYNTLGHASQVGAPLSPGQLAMFSFVPTQGSAGTQVTLNGQGFSATPANNTAMFNGTLATVLSATTTQLLVTVPANATTGAISVTVGTQTAASATPFVINDAELPPTVTQVSPAIVSVDGTVTVTGTRMDPVAGNTTVQMANHDMVLSSISDTQLQYVASSTAISGRVTVATPYGFATSATPIAVLPSGLSAVSGGYALTNGAGINLTMGAGQIGAVSFDGSAGEWASLQVSYLTSSASTINYTVYDSGNVVFQQGTLSTSSPTIHLSPLKTTGTYLVTFEPDTASAQMTVSVETNPQLTSAGATAIAAVASGQSKRVLFQAAQGANLELALNTISVTNGGSTEVDVNTYNYNAGGTQIDSSKCYGSNPGASCRIFLWGMAAGNYTVVMTPANGGVMSFNATLQPPIMGPVLTANNPVSVNLAAGQFEQLTFNATAGQSIALNMSSVSTTPARSAVYVGVYRPDVGQMTPYNYYTYFDANQTQTINLPGLPVSGIYTLIVNSPYGLPTSGKLTLVPATVGTLSSSAGSQAYNTSVPGQNIYLSFSANAGDNFEVGLNHIAVAGDSSGAVYLNVYGPSGAQIINDTCYGSSAGSSCRDFLWGLAAGNYSVILSPVNGGTMSLNATLQPPVTGPVLTPNNPLTVNLGAGQYGQLTFNATAGQSVTVTMTGVSTTPSGQRLYVGVYRPDVGQMTPYNYYNYFDASSSPSMSLPNLPVSGTYTLIVNNPLGLPASGQLSISTP